VDIIVGAHAELKADSLLTLDAARYRVAFPKLVTMMRDEWRAFLAGRDDIIPAR